MAKSRKKTYRKKSAGWLPIDSRLISPIFSFGRVRGVARLFLTVEMALATLVVLGTLLLVFLSAFF